MLSSPTNGYKTVAYQLKLEVFMSSYPHEPYKIIISDDDHDVHLITELILKNVQFEGRSLVFFHAYSEQQTQLLFTEHPDAAVVFQDVVMDTKTSGLDLVKFLRGPLNNRKMRIILRTGNPGDAPEKSIVMDYDINDYKLKTDLTHQQLVISLYQALRSFRDLTLIETKTLAVEQMFKLSERQNQQLKAQNELLQYKDQILSIISHDLRSPLSSLAGSLNLINQDSDSFDYLVQKGVFAQLSNKVNGSLELLEDLLLWSKCSLDNLVYQAGPVTLNRVIEEVLPLYRTLAKEKDITINFHAKETSQLSGDPNLLATILRNTLSNALKFTNHGGMIAVSSTTEGGFTVLKIIDTGIGISEERIAQLFNPKMSSNEVGTAGEKGTGFGLSLTRHLVEKMNGSLVITSKQGEGTCVTARFHSHVS